jgi:hypothetical protein
MSEPAMDEAKTKKTFFESENINKIYVWLQTFSKKKKKNSCIEINDRSFSHHASQFFRQSAALSRELT